MRRGWPLITCAWLAAVAAVVAGALLPLPAWAENTAESKSPTGASAPAHPVPPPPPVEEAAKDSGAATGEEVSSEEVAGDETDGEIVTGEEAGSVAEAPAPSGTTEEVQPPVADPAGNTAEGPVSEPEPQPVIPEDGDSVAEAAPPGNGPAAIPPPLGEPKPAEGPPAIAGNAAESTFTQTPDPAAAEVPTAGPEIASNAAEARPAGTGAGNLAEGGTDTGLDENGVAIPPEPEYRLPSPDELAGSTLNYTAPEFSVTVPAIQFAPDRDAAESYIQPQRHYLENRPLPALDETEPEEERQARSIEESLVLLNLAMEERPESGVQIPLPSGLMTFKASNSFQYDRRNKILTFSGDVELLFNDIAIWADVVEVDDGAATAYARGYVAVQQQENILYCDEAYLNYDTETLELFWVEGNTGGKRLSEPLYFEAERAYGSFDHIIMEKAVITTCDPFCGAHRDYEIKADKLHYKPGKSIVLHNAYLFLRDTKTGWFPVLAIPMPKQQRKPEDESDVIQQYGWSRQDGYYAKFGYTYWTKWVEGVNDPLKGVAIMEVMTKRGVGLGVRQDYYIPEMGVGTLRTYYKEDWPESVATDLIGRTEANAGTEYRIEWNQDLQLSPHLNGNLSFARNNSVGTTGSLTNSWDSQFRMGFTQGTTNVTLNSQHRVNVTGGTTNQVGVQQPRSENIGTSANLGYETKITKDLILKYDQGYTANKGGLYSKLPADQEGNYGVRLTWTGDRETNLAGYQASVTYKESAIDYDGDKFDNKTERNKPLNDQLPSFHLTLPNDLLGEKSFFNKFGVDVDRLITGQRSDPTEATSYHLNMGGSRNQKFSNSASMNYSTDMHQYWYSDGSSQYALLPRVTFNYDSQGWWQFNTSWNMTYQQGVRNPPAPRRYTYTQSANYRLTMGNRRSWRWILNSGYDFRTWQHTSIGSSFNWDAHRLLGLTHTATYDVNQSKWLRSSIKATSKSPYRRDNGLINWFLTTSVDYQSDYMSQFRVDRLGLRYFHSFKDGWSGEVLAEYKPTTDPKTMSTDDYMKDFIKKIVVRKTGCCTSWEATWRTQINEFSLILYLNALPQYAGTLDIVQPFDNDMDTNFLFPSETVRANILEDVMGLSAEQQRFLGGR